jgi:hypothetical protein
MKAETRGSRVEESLDSEFQHERSLSLLRAQERCSKRGQGAKLQLSTSKTVVIYCDSFADGVYKDDFGANALLGFQRSIRGFLLLSRPGTCSTPSLTSIAFCRRFHSLMNTIANPDLYSGTHKNIYNTNLTNGPSVNRRIQSHRDTPSQKECDKK